MRLTRTLPPHLRGELRAEQFRILRTHIPILHAMLAINTFVLCVSVYDTTPAALSLVIPSIFASLIFVRAMIWVVRARRPPDERAVARYLLVTTILSGAVSLGLGLWGVALLDAKFEAQPFVPLFFAFGAIACTYCLASLPRAAFATIFLATTPVIAALLMSSARIEMAAGVDLLLILLLILVLIVHQYNYVVDRVIAHAQLKALGYVDHLTALPNRRAFIECLEDVIGTRADHPTRAAVAMIDLDGFKAINDTYGHAAGDVVLIQAASRIQSACDNCRMVARLGGDEFAVLTVGLDDAALTALGQTLVGDMSLPFAAFGSQLRLAASIGIATQIDDDVAAMAIMSRADVALYEVKHRGGEGVMLFEPDMSARVRRRVLVEQALRETDPRPQIKVVFQPIFNARTRHITSFEALARWDHPQLGEIDPLEFISVAERSGTSATLSKEIFAAAIEEAAGWAAPIGLSVNLSAVDLCRADTPATIMALCERHSFAPDRLEVEVTETSVLSDFDAARHQLNLLRQSGIRVSLDDFGSGFASIAYLKEITFDRVKIDGGLIADIIKSPQATRLVQGILQLCSAIGVPTTAEWVESEDQLALLVGLGCDRVQGYLLSQPLTAREARQLAGRKLTRHDGDCALRGMTNPSTSARPDAGRSKRRGAPNPGIAR